MLQGVYKNWVVGYMDIQDLFNLLFAYHFACTKVPHQHEHTNTLCLYFFFSYIFSFPSPLKWWRGLWGFGCQLRFVTLLHPSSPPPSTVESRMQVKPFSAPPWWRVWGWVIACIPPFPLLTMSVWDGFIDKRAQLSFVKAGQLVCSHWQACSIPT